MKDIWWLYDLVVVFYGEHNGKLPPDESIAMHTAVMEQCRRIKANPDLVEKAYRAKLTAQVLA